MKKNRLEHLVFGVSCVLVAAVLGALVYDAWMIRESPPAIEIALGPSFSSGGFHHLPATVRNTGGTVAADLVVEAVLYRDGREIERAELAIQFLPRRSSQRGTFVFRADPGVGEVVARPVSFRAP